MCIIILTVKCVQTMLLLSRKITEEKNHRDEHFSVVLFGSFIKRKTAITEKMSQSHSIPS